MLLRSSCRPCLWRRALRSRACAAAPSPEQPPEDAVVSEARRAVVSHSLLRRGDSVVACVSGGVDSIALLLVLARLAPDLSLRLHVLHFNHALRAESEAEARLVARAAEAAGATLHTLVASPSHWRPTGVPAQARAWRRGEALRLAERLQAEGGGAVRVALGHHADDSRETLLLKLLRGVHLSRVRGLSPRAGAFVRPLLGCSKEQLYAFVASSGAEWAEDASNRDPSASRRNAVRLQLVPLLQELSGGALDARLRDVAEQSAALRGLLQQAPRTWAPRALETGQSDVDVENGEEEEDEAPLQVAPKGVAPGDLDFDAWLRLPPLIRLEQLHAFVCEATGEALAYATLRELARRCEAADQRLTWAAHVDARWQLERSGSRLRMRLRDEAGGEVAETVLHPADGGLPLRLSHPRGWRVCLGDVGDEQGLLVNVPADGAALQLRTRRDGDCIARLKGGRPSLLRLARLLRDEHTPLHERDRLPLLVQGKRVLAVWPRWVACGLEGRSVRLIVET